MREDEFDGIVGEVYDSIPERFRNELGETVIMTEDGCGDDPDLLGLFEGVSRIEQSINDIAPLPNRIVIFRTPVLGEAADTDGDVRRVVRETMIHEIAHALGYDEAEIEEKFESRWS